MVPLRIPSVEIADHADALRVRRPDAEHHTPRHDVRPELLPKLAVRPFVEEMEVPVGEERSLFSGRWPVAGCRSGVTGNGYFNRPLGDDVRAHVLRFLDHVCGTLLRRAFARCRGRRFAGGFLTR